MIHVRRWQRQSHTHTRITSVLIVKLLLFYVSYSIHILHSCTSLKTIQKIIVKILSWLNNRIRCMRNSFLNRHCKNDCDFFLCDVDLRNINRQLHIQFNFHKCFIRQHLLEMGLDSEHSNQKWKRGRIINYAMHRRTVRVAIIICHRVDAGYANIWNCQSYVEKSTCNIRNINFLLARIFSISTFFFCQ